MKLSFRYFGIKDSIPLNYIKQIPNMFSVVTSLYEQKPGEKWEEDDLKKLKEHCDKNGLQMEVIESIPVHEDIKLGKSSRDKYIENYIYNLRLCAKYGVKCVCYNFMPVFDWVRTNLEHQNSDGSTSLMYDEFDANKIDINSLHLPGWDESYSSEELNGLLKEYKDISHEKLFDNLIYFLNKIVPILEEINVNMAIHPDDPPWDIFGLPRIVSTYEDLEKLFTKIPSKRNGLTLCVASLAESKQNDIYKITDRFSKENRVHFAHLRNIKFIKYNNSFIETSNESIDGDINMSQIVEILVKNGFDGYVRADHGRNIFGEKSKPGYGLYDRALGAAYINGLFEMAERKKNEK